GWTSDCSAHFFIASIEACKIFSSSISSGIHHCTVQQEDIFLIFSINLRRSSSERALLSRISSSNEQGSNITPAATTGPARHPLPTSSSPTISEKPSSQSIISK